MANKKLFRLLIVILSFSLLILFGLGIASYSCQNRYGTSGINTGMMNSWYSPSDSQSTYGIESKLSIDEIRSKVQHFLQSYGNDLEIADLFIYSDTDYYVSIEEKSTGKGAMELLVNPYTGSVYPEHGPNMMWNQKYGMMGRGMMGTVWNTGSNNVEKVSPEEAQIIANTYLKNHKSSKYAVMEAGHSFYGYYTLHFGDGNKPVGMLSVNSYTGEVWYHNWHGYLERVIEHDESQ